MYRETEYRGQHVIRETIKALVTETVTWDQACDIVHAQFVEEGLTSSAEQVLNHKRRGK